MRPVNEVNTDEALVPRYELPDPLVASSGAVVRSTEAWFGSRRGEILDLFRSEVYGYGPEPAEPLPSRVLSTQMALDGRATRRQVRVQLVAGRLEPSLDLLLYLPATARGPVPVFLGLNFFGNHSIHPDPGITLSERWMPPDPAHGVTGNHATESARGTSRSRWPVETIVARGYGLATAYCGDVEPDHPGGFHSGVRGALPDSDPSRSPWGTISAWAFGLRRALDYLQRDPDVDARRVIALGHSRLGKAALWAGAQDERFAAVISNDSGCMGAALSRRRFGETVAFTTKLFPHWFPPRLAEYAEREDALPVDQHMLLALIAPRPLYVASADEDLWADPRGEFLSAVEASRVYRFLGVDGLAASEMPDVEEPLPGRVSHHLRSGRHDLTAWDWERFLIFADAELPGQEREGDG